MWCLSVVFVGRNVCVKEVADKISLVSFMQYDLGFFDTEKGRVEPAPDPFVPDRCPAPCSRKADWQGRYQRKPAGQGGRHSATESVALASRDASGSAKH